MSRLSGDEIVTQGHVRIYRQPGGPGPDRPVLYAGKQTQYLMVGGLNRSIRGGVTPVYVPDPSNRKRFRQVARTEEAPALSTFDVTALQKHGSIPFTLGDLTCEQNYYLSVGTCKDPSDFSRGWSDIFYILSGGLVTDDVDMGDPTGWETDDQIEHQMTYTADAIYAAGRIGFGEKAAPYIDREAIDVVYGSNIECGDCGPTDDGTKRIYWLIKASGAGSPGLPSEIVYTVDGGATFAEATITNIGANIDASAIDIAGDKLIVLVNGEDAYYWATINATTGVPGSFTKVTSGFVAAGSPNDLYVLDSNNVFMVGDAGYIYKLSAVGDAVTVISAGTVTTQVLNRIDGDGEDTIVIAGYAATVITSINRGVTFASTTAAPGSPGVGTNSLQALAVIDNDRFWVGSSQGYLFYTTTGGETWVQSRFSGDQSGAIYDIVFPTREVGYISHSTSTPTARIFGTWNGGANWTNESPRFQNLPTFNRATRLATPTVGSSTNGMTTASNNLAVAGLSGGGTDGIALIGAASII